MKKSFVVVLVLMMFVIAACSTAAPTPETIVVTATGDVPTQAPPPTSEPVPDDGNPPVFLAIISPRTDTLFESTSFLEVTGSARGMPNDDVIVLFVDKGLNVYGYACAELGAPNANNIKTYRTELTTPVDSVTDGKVIAGVFNEDGSIAGSAGVFASAEPDSDQKYVTVETPGNHCVITTPDSFTVKGSAQGGFENNIVVQAQDARGNVLAEGTTIYSSSSSGEPGTWSVTLRVDVPTGSEGRLVAFSPDPTGGSPINSPVYTVIYGE